MLFSFSIKGLSNKEWVISFYQLEMFPALKPQWEYCVSLGFDWLEPGRYSFLIDVKDRLTDKSTSHFFQPVIE